MTEIIFKNRITQEAPNIIKQLKSLWIDMNLDKKQTQNTPNGLFALTLNPNNFVDTVKLEKDFKSILSHYYHCLLYTSPSIGGMVQNGKN